MISRPGGSVHGEVVPTPHGGTAGPAAWWLTCSACGIVTTAAGLPTVCHLCAKPWLVRYAELPSIDVRARLSARPLDMWRYREWLPIDAAETPITLGEGGTPLLSLPRLATSLGLRTIWIKDEALNPTGSFKARGLAVAITRARAGGATAFTVPTAGNAGVALSAYARRAGLAAHVFAPRDTPPRLVQQMRTFGADVRLLDGHIGDCGRAARAHATQHGAFDVSTLREPYRIEGKKTLGLELAEQLDWRLPDVIIYPTGGGTGLIGMWKAFDELRRAGWLSDATSPRLVSVQAAGCAPVAAAVEQGLDHTDEWRQPHTVAAGLRVPAPLGGSLILRALRDTNGTALAVTDDALTGAQQRLADEGVDACPEGGATLAALEELVRQDAIESGASVVLFNTGAGWLYRKD